MVATKEYIALVLKALDNKRSLKTKRKAAKRRKERSEQCSEWKTQKLNSDDWRIMEQKTDTKKCLEREKKGAERV